MESVEHRVNGGVLRAKGAAAFLAIGESTFWRWVAAGRIPKGTRLSARATVWPVDVLRAFLEQQATQGGAS